MHDFTGEIATKPVLDLSVEGRENGKMGEYKKEMIFDDFSNADKILGSNWETAGIGDYCSICGERFKAGDIISKIVYGNRSEIIRHKKCNPDSALAK